MSDKEHELFAAAKALLPYLEASTDHRDSLIANRAKPIEEIIKEGDERRAGYEISPADKLRRQADAIEVKDAAIKRFRAAVAALDGGHDIG